MSALDVTWIIRLLAMGVAPVSTVRRVTFSVGADVLHRVERLTALGRS